jgi:hypothetical protein
VATKFIPAVQALQTSADAFVEDIHAGDLQIAYGWTLTGAKHVHFVDYR